MYNCEVRYARLRKTIKGTVEKKNAEIAELKTLLAGHEEKIEELTIDLHICSKERDSIVAEKELDQVLATEISNRHTEICLERKALKAENAELKRNYKILQDKYDSMEMCDNHIKRNAIREIMNHLHEYEGRLIVDDIEDYVDANWKDK